MLIFQEAIFWHFIILGEHIMGTHAEQEHILSLTACGLYNSDEKEKIMKVIYKITYPNDKIYVGQDTTDSIMTYFGSGDHSYINNDATLKGMKKFKICKEILWESETATPQELKDKEDELIKELGANDPKKGYNLRPKFGA